MNINQFMSHHGLTENPFAAEEARHDPVFARLADADRSHPEFDKILGRMDQPSTAIVFGEKGSGKTAIRLLIEKRISQHNAGTERCKALLVPYDDLNPVLDQVVESRANRQRKDNTEKVLGAFRLEDHQDAILASAVTQLTSALLGEQDRHSETPLTRPLAKGLKKGPRGIRADAAVLAAIYDEPASSSAAHRFNRLKAKLRLGGSLSAAATLFLRIALAVTALGLAIAYVIMKKPPLWVAPAMWASVIVAATLTIMWMLRQTYLWWLSRRICRDTPTVDRSPQELRAMLSQLRRSDLAHVPWPTTSGGKDSRYDLTRRLIGVLRHTGYCGIFVLVDRVDEPTLVHGQTDRMRSVVWPMFDNKFLQQDGVGVKLLLPIELRHALHRESASFFQEARLDKQNLIDHLTWSGATLFDLCTDRLRCCRSNNNDKDQSNQASLTDLFEPDVTRQTLVDALDQMRQPRDAFKFIYTVVLEYCQTVTQDQATYHIPRLTLESVRRQQAQRVQELYRGLVPA